MYNTSANYKNKILADSTKHVLKIYIDNQLINPNHIFDFSASLNLINNSELCLGCAPILSIEFKIHLESLPQSYSEVYVETGISGEIIPLGTFIIKKPVEKANGAVVTIKAEDYMKKFDDTLYDGSDLVYPQTLKAVAEDICNKVGVELGSTSFLNMNKQISVYDNSISARKYIGYIAEQASAFAIIGRDKKLYFKSLVSSGISFNKNLFREFSWGDLYKISKVSYEDGIQDYKYGNETYNTLYIDSNNVYIVDSNQIENIYTQVNGLELYSFEGETIIDPAYDIGDILIIDGKNVLYQGAIQYEGKFKAKIQSKLAPKKAEESMQTKISNTTKFRKIQSLIDQENARILQLIAETTEHENRLTQITQDLYEIESDVSVMLDFQRNASGTNIVHLENTSSLDNSIQKIKITGNRDLVYPSVKTFLSNQLFLRSQITELTLVFSNQSGRNISNEHRQVVIPMSFELKMLNENIYDEIVIADSKVTITKRVGLDANGNKYELDNPIITEYANITIPSYKDDTYVWILEEPSFKMEIAYLIDNPYIQNFVPKVELGTQIIQNYESVKYAWNQISDAIKMMIFKNNLSLCIINEAEKVITSFDKNGQHFYDEEEANFGDMGVKTITERDGVNENEYNYIAFSVPGEYGSFIRNGMAWGVETPDKKFWPIMFVRNFFVANQGGGDFGGQIELNNADMVIGATSGITNNAVRLSAEPTGELTFTSEVNEPMNLLTLYPEGHYEQLYGALKLLSNIWFFKNQAGSNSFRVGSQNKCALLTDEGEVIATNEVNCYNGVGKFGKVECYGNIYCNNGVQPFSLAEKKKNIKKYDHKALDEVLKTDIYMYNYKDDKDGCKIRVGAIIGKGYNISKEIIGVGGKGIDTYSMESIAYKAIQELNEIIKNQQKQIDELNDKINEMKGGAN